ncbi:MAG: FHA domain-containing protein [Spongiibacteraceae bacterium]|jgi:hypothetical protein|nr:FHA domain-containing protein [Spongiibacteraceae bacterium]
MLKIQLKSNPSKGHWLVGEQLTIGTHSDNDLRLQGPGIAAFHLEIAIQGERLTLSMPGGSCQVNGRPGREGQALNPGDLLRLGQSELELIDPKQITARSPHTRPRSVQGWWLTVDHPEGQPRRFELDTAVVLGRAADCDISLPYGMLSRRHASLRPVAEGIELQDLASSNGTFINNQRIDEALLKAGDTFCAAGLRFTINAPHTTINQTILRPALTDDAIAAATRCDKRAARDEPNIQVSIDVAQSPAEAHPANTGRWGWSIAVLVAGIVAAAGWWLLRTG